MAAALLILFALWFAVRRLPVQGLVVAGAKALHGMGLTGVLLTGLGIYLLTLLLLPSAEAIEQGRAAHGALVWILLAIALLAAALLGPAAARRLRRSAGGP